MKITSFGTTTLLFDDGDNHILFDAHFTRPTIMQYLFKKVSSDDKLIDKMLKKHGINKVDAIFVLHSHYDHVMDAPYIAKKMGAKIYGSITTKNIALGQNVDSSQIEVFEEYRSYKIGDFKITIIPSIHSKPNAFNDDLGEEITEPLKDYQNLKNFKEGDSYDFYIENKGKRYLIHPSCNYIKSRLDGYETDVLYLALAGIMKMNKEKRKEFFDETIGVTAAKLVIPIHWDNLFRPLYEPTKGMPKIAERTDLFMFELVNYCEKHGVDTVIQLPRTSFEI
ncbi:MBL fold metallo-hydrolase [Helcococcus kunzii]|uniref:MBL fold metallo-hydrolase n=1 Tax=Helcococcus kunzii TaxID=40091 RepID=UPI001BB05E39|nr:MBL fold metallo-hydrolase [Helcococcus kunzii]QUY65654.1 MBL fold metallo-hydrolase [Helcococcus kunzii]